MGLKCYDSCFQNNIGTLNVLKVEPFLNVRILEPFGSNIRTIMYQKKNLILCSKKRTFRF